MNSGNENKDRRVLQAVYRSSQRMSKIAISIIAFLEVMMIVYSFINSGHYGEYLWRYRCLYIALLSFALIYICVDLFVNKDLSNRYKVLNIVNPIYSLGFFAWALAITYSDAFILNATDPVVFMTFSLMIPLSIYLHPFIYAAIVTLADIAFLVVFVRTNGISAVIINIFVFFIFQYALGISFQYLRLKLAERLVDEEIKARIDVLTGCRNRLVYEEDVKKTSGEALPGDFVYISLDVNGLKDTNDSFGHDCGDKLLIGAARSIEGAFGEQGVVYRIGGDEFVAMINAGPDELRALCSRHDSLMERWSENNSLSLSISRGCVSSADYPGKDIGDLSLIADKKMYEVKKEYYEQAGKDRRRPE